MNYLMGAILSCTTRNCTLNFTCREVVVSQTNSYLVIHMFKDLLSNIIGLLFKTCLVLKNKSIKFNIFDTVVHFK